MAKQAKKKPIFSAYYKQGSKVLNLYPYSYNNLLEIFYSKP